MIRKLEPGEKTTYVSKIGKTNYFVTSSFHGEEDIIEKFEKMIIADYEKSNRQP